MFVRGEKSALSGKSIASERGSVAEVREISAKDASSYELVRYPSGQLVITKLSKNSAFRDVVGTYTNELDAQAALSKLAAG